MTSEALCFLGCENSVPIYWILMFYGAGLSSYYCIDIARIYLGYKKVSQKSGGRGPYSLDFYFCISWYFSKVFFDVNIRLDLVGGGALIALFLLYRWRFPPGG